MKYDRKRLLVIIVAAMLLNFCVMSVSVEAKTHTLGTSVTNQFMQHGGGTVQYKGRIYCAVGNSIYSMKSNGSDKKLIYREKAKGQGFQKLTISGNTLFAVYAYGYSEAWEETLISVDVKGKNFKRHTQYGAAESVIAVDGKVYYTEHKYGAQNTMLCSMNAKGKNKKILLNKKGLTFLATDGKYLYYKINTYGKKTKSVIYRCNMNGKNQEKLVDNKQYIIDYQCTLDDKYFYYAYKDTSNENLYYFYRVRLNKCITEKLFEYEYDFYDTRDGVHAIYTDAGKLYALVSCSMRNGKRELKKIDLQSSSSVQLGSGKGDFYFRPFGLENKLTFYQEYRFDQNPIYGIYKYVTETGKRKTIYTYKKK